MFRVEVNLHWAADNLSRDASIRSGISQPHSGEKEDGVMSWSVLNVNDMWLVF